MDNLNENNDGREKTVAENEIVFGTYGRVLKNTCYIIGKETDNELVYGIMLKNILYEYCIPAMFDKIDDAEKFADLLVKYDVSPIHLFEIADDYMGSIV